MNNSRITTPERLREVLEAFGGNPARWPEDEREALEKCLAENPERRTDYEDAQTLDLLLGRIGDMNRSDFSQFSAHIMARIEESIRLEADPQAEAIAQHPKNSETIVDLMDHRRKEVVSPPLDSASGWSMWQTAGLLAASFAFGIYIGATLLSEPAAEGVAQLSGAHNPPAMEFTIFQSGTSEFFEGDL